MTMWSGLVAALSVDEWMQGGEILRQRGGQIADRHADDCAKVYGRSHRWRDMRALNRHGNPKESHGLNQERSGAAGEPADLNMAGWLLGWIEQQVPSYAGRSIPAVVPFGPVPNQ